MADEVNEAPVTEEPGAAPAEPAAAEAPATPEPAVAPSDAPNAPEVAQPSETAPVDPGASEGAPEAMTLSDLKIGDTEITVEIPPDLIQFGSENGLDMEALTKEFYSNDQDLSAESKQALYDKFPKWQVDGFLTGAKARNDLMVKEHQAGLEAQAKAGEEAAAVTLELMGGEDRWHDLEGFALNTLDDAQLAEFNEIMSSNNSTMQQLAIKDLWGKFTEAGAPVAPVTLASLDLEDGSNRGPAGSVGAPMTAAELAAVPRDEYKKNMQMYDDRRLAGIRKGI